MGVPRRRPVGVELVEEGERGAHFRVWAPTHDKVTLVLEPRREITMQREADGYHAVFAAGVGAGTRYRFRLGDDQTLHADPASRFQPEGPFGPSEVIDPTFPWTDRAWRGIDPKRHVLYEMHVGTFTPGGTWTSAAARLPFLAELGVTTLELMPLGDFAGTRNWGYDGVNLWAPTRNYGTPDDFRRFVDRAHALGVAVILDVVYNHFGPAGNSMFAWSPLYKATRATEWGEALSFAEKGAREYYVSNAAYWIDEFHLDGLRIDATQTITDESDVHILADITRAARAAGNGRQIFLVGENEPQDAALLAEPIGLDALWNDDFHHTSRVALTGVVDGYLHDYGGTPQEIVSAVKRGFLYQGQFYPWQQNPRGTPTRGFAPHRFVNYLENHDQCANLGFGERLAEIATTGQLRAMTAVLLLGPALPMLFQGQETGSRRPWLFFVDHAEDLHAPIRNGRAQFLKQFTRLASPEAQAALPDPCVEATFARCVLETIDDNAYVRLHRDLLRLRREDPAFLDANVDGAVLGPEVFALRFFREDAAGDRLLLVNLGPTFRHRSVPEPLIAPPANAGWRVGWSSEHPQYGGHGTAPVFTRGGVALPSHSAVLLVPDPERVIEIDPHAVSGDKLPPESEPA
ncbi:MAG: malto-oligosyltrehalose trehalohydrolase [Myxococcota bacterium]|nr:malto-oligosyltrehalose trehalohydrolase [Deltaproteobacteria bacterium]MDQ3337688.1 malto-oligosyltrehalose trehalohydrolase [Myxococcota bacterium]